MDQDIKQILSQCSVSTRMTALTFGGLRFIANGSTNLAGYWIENQIALKNTADNTFAVLLSSDGTNNYIKNGNVSIGTTAALTDGNRQLGVSAGITGDVIADLVVQWARTTNTAAGRIIGMNKANRIGAINFNRANSADDSGDISLITYNATTPGEVMRLTYNGNVGIGTTGPNYQLELSTDSAGKPGVGGLWTVVSDERIKADIELADLKRCYDIIKSVPLKRFAWAEVTYTEKQVRDRHNLGWIAQDVQKVFPKAVNTVPFTRPTEIPDGEEEYEEQDFVMETVEKESVSIEIRDGIAIQVKKVSKEEIKTLLFDACNVFDENGNQVFTENDGEHIPATHKVPRMVKKTRPKHRHEVIEDCLDLNNGQLYAAMYGALQFAMQRIEELEKKVYG